MKRFIVLSLLFLIGGLVIVNDKGPCLFKCDMPNRVRSNNVNSLFAQDPLITERITLQVYGISCRSCVKDIRSALLKIAGVKDVKVDFNKAEVVILILKGEVNEKQLTNAVKDASNIMYSYTARVIKKETI